ncbi:MAG: NADP-dependent oxidoreductase [Alphaproteobacteria bacterium]|nr:NADP-dependent oxidoreductase [Alphaproteobacteria bacterium]
MRAAVIDEYGPPSNLVVREVDAPPLTRPTEVRVDIHASSINPIDWKIRAGKQRGAVRYRLPRALGMDFSGVVSEIGSAVTAFAVGDEVFGSPAHTAPGCYAEQTVVEAAEIAKKPSNLTHEEAATLPLVGLTAWQCLMPKLRERTGQRVFVMAGSGGVGSFAIQLAKHHGAWVATTCSEKNAELVRGLGADEVIDYRTTRFEDVLSDLDLVLDTMGHEETQRALPLVKKGGRLASIVSGLPENTERFGANLGVAATGLHILQLKVQGWRMGIDASTVVKRPRGDELAEIAALVEQGAIRAVVDRVFPLDAIAEAHAYGETGRIRGKVAIRVR